MSATRRARLQTRAQRLPVPVVVVGNINVGGSGKTPLVIYLVRLLQKHKMRVGVVSRGYGASASHARMVQNWDPLLYGDEAVCIARATKAPVVVGHDRVAAARLLLELQQLDVVISDDGMQHYRLARDLEIAAVDAARGFGNGFGLPAGPLREPPDRLRQCDFVLSLGAQKHPLAAYCFWLEPRKWVRVSDGQVQKIAFFAARHVHALAGIGHPERFFRLLDELGISAEEHAFADHHRFQPADLAFIPAAPIVMTEKDAVKCVAFAPPDSWYLAVEAQTEDGFSQAFLARFDQVRKRYG